MYAGSSADWLASRVMTAIATMIAIDAIAWWWGHAAPGDPVQMLCG